MSGTLSNEEIEDRFFVLSRMEILSVLNDLIQRREGVTVSFNGGRSYFLTTLLEARHEALIFDLGGDREANDRLLQSDGCVFVARPGGVRVQFSAGRVRRFSWGGSDAFWVPMPERIVRLQRRESFRVLMPVVSGPLLTFRIDPNGGPIELPIHDMSVGGLGLTVIGDSGLATGEEVGEVLRRMRFRLPDHDAIECVGTVRHFTRWTDGRGGQIGRMGVRFDGLPRSSEVLIQRCIIEIEHERRALLAE